MNKEIFAKNLKKLREKEGLTKTALSKIIGCDQPKLTKLEDPKSKICPTVDNLISLSEHYHISINQLLGVNAQKNQDTPKTMADIIQYLFDIDELTNIGIDCHTEEKIEIDEMAGYPDLVPRNMYKLSFEEHGVYYYYLNDFMKEWKETKEYFKDKDSAITTKMYSLWKKDKLEKASSKYLDTFSVIPDGVTNIPGFINEELPFH